MLCPCGAGQGLREGGERQEISAKLARHPETRVAGETVARQGPITGLEDMEGNLRVRVEHGREGKHTQALKRRLIRKSVCHRHQTGTKQMLQWERARHQTQEGPATRPVLLTSSMCLHTTHTAPACGVVCGGRLVGRPETRTGSSAATIIRRALNHVSCAAAPPTSTSVTRVQSGGSPSSVERVDVIGSSFPMGQRAISRSRSFCKYLPRGLRCEPLLTWPFANTLVAAPCATQSSSDLRPDTPVDAGSRPWGARDAPGVHPNPGRRIPPGSVGDDRPARPAE